MKTASASNSTGTGMNERPKTLGKVGLNIQANTRLWKNSLYSIKFETFF